MIHWLRFSVKADNLQVYHLCPALPTAADRIYIRYTYQTPLSHLLTRWWLPNLPKPGSSSQHHTTSLRLQIEMREWMRERCKKKKKSPLQTSFPHWDLFFMISLCVCLPPNILLHFPPLTPSSLALPLSLVSPPFISRLVTLSLHVQHRLRDSSFSPCQDNRRPG